MRRKTCFFMFPVFAIIFIFSLYAGDSAAETGGQVFFRYGMANFNEDRGGQVFTDTLNVFGEGRNDGNGGWNVSAGLDTCLIKFGPGSIIGEIMVDYARYSKKEATQTTSTLLQLDGVGTHETTDVTVSELAVVVAPKYRFENIAGGKVRPWIIPAGLAFLVNSPPSNDTTYLDIGYHMGAGIEYVFDKVSIGVDYRYTIASGEPGFKANYSTAAVYLGINF